MGWNWKDKNATIYDSWNRSWYWFVFNWLLYIYTELKMNELKTYTIDDLNKLKGWERTQALMKWQDHLKRSWKNGRKENLCLTVKIDRKKRIHEGRCGQCGKAREREKITLCNSCIKKNYIKKKELLKNKTKEE